jgi:hypothetical protein
VNAEDTARAVCMAALFIDAGLIVVDEERSCDLGPTLVRVVARYRLDASDDDAWVDVAEDTVDESEVAETVTALAARAYVAQRDAQLEVPRSPRSF